MYLKLLAEGNKLYIDKSELLTQGTIGQSLQVSLDEKWNALSVTAVFSAGLTVLDVVLQGNVVTIPWQLLREKGKKVFVNLYGTANDGTTVLTTNIISLGIVLPSVPPSEITPAEFTPPRIDQIQEIALRAQRMAATAMGYAPKTPEVVDESPISNSENLIASGGVQKALSRRNLLDNWYFGNPVNQRGAKPHVITENATLYRDIALSQAASSTVSAGTAATYVQDGVYSVQISESVLRYIAAKDVANYNSTGYSIDRWYLGHRQSYGELSLEANGVRFSHFGSTGYTDLHQPLEDKLMTALTGKTITVSAVIDGELYSDTYVFGETGMVYFGSLQFFRQSSNNRAFLFRATAGVSALITAVKLELGDTQTLAHQEAGVWVLNEIPDYGEELLKCQRYYWKSETAGGTSAYYPSLFLYREGRNSGSARLECRIPYSVEMRTIPAVKVNNVATGGNVRLRAQETGQYLEGILGISSWDNNQRNKLLAIALENATYGGVAITSSTTIPGGMLEAYIEASADL